jgi:sigma-E factor negative regulatory protein RseA
MTQELSSLMDGELEGAEADRAIGGCCRNDELKQKWQAYHLIGDALRGDGPCRRASTERIMAAIREEPTVLAPRRPLSGSAGRIALAAAASVATVAVVGWIGLQERSLPAGPVVAKMTPPAAVEAPEVSQSAAPQQVNEYVVVHRQLPGAEYYRPASATAVVGGR